MSIIRLGQDGFEAYIYLEDEGSKINISTPSYKGSVTLREAVKVLNLLVKLEEVPDDIHDSVFREIEEALRLKEDMNRKLTIRVEELQHANKK